MSKINTLLFLFIISALFNNTIAQKKYPPSVVKYGETNYLMDSEFITNKGWTEFLVYQKNKFGETSEEYKRNIPNLTLWHNTYKDGDIMRFSGQYADYPIVGVSLKQITDFCAWRADRVEEKYNQKYVCRLPTEKESSDFYEKKKTKSAYSNLIVSNGKQQLISFQETNHTPSVSDYTADKIFYFFCVFDKVK